MSKKKGDRKTLSPLDREVIYQTFLTTDNKTETARRCGVSISSVYNVLTEAEADGTDMRQARAKAAGQLASKAHVKAEVLMDSITAADIDSGRIALYDKDGKFAGYKYYGPTLLQKATSIGILTDKANVLQTFEAAMVQDEHSKQLMLPVDIAGLKTAIDGQIKELSMLNVRFKDDNKELVTKVAETFSEIESLENDTQDVEDMSEFDN